MGAVSALQRILDSELTKKFARSLDYRDLPKGWAYDESIQKLASDAYKEMGTESPFFKAWFNGGKAIDKEGKPEIFTHTTQGTVREKGYGSDRTYEVEPPFEEFKNKFGGIYLRPEKYSTGDEISFGGTFPYEFNLFTNAKNVVDARDYPNRGKEKFVKAIKSQFSPSEIKDIRESTGYDKWNPVESFLDGTIYPDTGRTNQNYVVEGIKDAFDADAVRYKDDPNEAMVVFDPHSIKSVNNLGTFDPEDKNVFYGLLGAASGLDAAGVASDANASIPNSNGKVVPSSMQKQWDSYNNPMPEKPLETPVWSPIDLASAPIGVAGTGAKLTAMALDPAISIGADYLGGKLVQDEEDRKRAAGILGLFNEGNY